MMIKLPVILLLSLTVFHVNIYGQTRVITVKSQKEIDSVRNNTHFKIKMLSDSVWQASEYDLNDTIMNTGTYKDEKLQIPDGKFKIYDLIQPFKGVKYDYTNHRYDTIFTPQKNYLRYVGYFSNGKKTGTWYEYVQTGRLSLVEVFENNKLNGLYQSYNPETGKVLIEGNYVNDFREGNWNMLSFDGDVIRTDIYKHGKIIKTISHLSDKKFAQKITGGKPKYDFVKYLNNKLSDKKFDTPGIKTVLYSISQNKEGKLNEPSVIKGSDILTDTAIIDAILSAPNWEPAYMNGKLIDLSHPLNFEITISENKKIHISVKQY